MRFELPPSRAALPAISSGLGVAEVRSLTELLNAIGHFARMPDPGGTILLAKGFRWSRGVTIPATCIGLTVEGVGDPILNVDMEGLGADALINVLAPNCTFRNFRLGGQAGMAGTGTYPDAIFRLGASCNFTRIINVFGFVADNYFITTAGECRRCEVSGCATDRTISAELDKSIISNNLDLGEVILTGTGGDNRILGNYMGNGTLNSTGSGNIAKNNCGGGTFAGTGTWANAGTIASDNY